MKTLFITGGAKRVGKAIALKFAEKGFDICFTYNGSEKEARETEKEIEKMGRKVLVLKGNLKETETIIKWKEDFFKVFKKCDCLINNASVFYKTPFNTIKEKEWDDIFDTNLKAPFLICKHFGEEMLKEKNGVIINIADVCGTVPWKNYIAYSVSQAGLIMLTKVLAKELAPFVRVCAIAPGPVLLPENYTEKEKQDSIKRTLLKKLGEPEDIARASYFIFKNKFITGTDIKIDGGRSIY